MAFRTSKKSISFSKPWLKSSTKRQRKSRSGNSNSDNYNDMDKHYNKEKGGDDNINDNMEVLIFNHHTTSLEEKILIESIECLLKNEDNNNGEEREQYADLKNICPISNEKEEKLDHNAPPPGSASVSSCSTTSSDISTSCHSNALCRCEQPYICTPPAPPMKWEQRPLLLRATPNSGMSILGVRYVSSSDYLPPLITNNDTCSSCTILPINNGNEAPGYSLVTDFTTAYFKGTLLLRIRHCKPGPHQKQQHAYDDSIGYFSKFNRQYQSVIRGKFLTPDIPMNNCYTGHIFNRQLSNLPSRMIRSPIIKIMHIFAPRLNANFEQSNPQFTSPLLSTPQCIISKDTTSPLQDLEEILQEPTDETSILHDLLEQTSEIISITTGTTPPHSYRKKIADGHNSNKNETFFNVNKEYTFEFLQHLVHYPTFSINIPKTSKSYCLSKLLNGQPLKIMAGFYNDEKTKDVNLWDFELWNEAVYDDAHKFEKEYF